MLVVTGGEDNRVLVHTLNAVRIEMGPTERLLVVCRIALVHCISPF